MSEAPGALTATNLNVGFESKSVLSDVSVALEPEQIIVIAGPNGAGKSTLIKTMARQLKPISGKVELAGEDIWTMTARKFAAQVAYVAQDLEVSNELTVEQIVMLGRNPHQTWWQWFGSSSDSTAVEKALNDTEMLHLRTKPVCQLSGGERQRAHLAIALAQEPKFMLLDEPTSHLDFKHQIELLGLLKRLRTNGIGVMLVLHDLNVMARVADSVLLIGRNDKFEPTDSITRSISRVAAFGTVQEALSIDNLKQVFDVRVSAIDDPVTGERVYNPFSLLKSTDN